MQLTVLELLNAAPVLRSLYSQKLRGVAALNVRRMCAKVDPELVAANTARNSLLDDENSFLVGSDMRQIKTECVDAFLAQPLFQEKVEVDVKPLTAADLADALISAEDLRALGPLVDQSL